ncbi:Uncharacterised protein [Neisseria gonorrhoeae]|nr:Uncharacterised protein [Neisseria gonorrhoeae]
MQMLGQLIHIHPTVFPQYMQDLMAVFIAQYGKNGYALAH